MATTERRYIQSGKGLWLGEPAKNGTIPTPQTEKSKITDPKQEILEAIQNFERYWLMRPMNDLRTREGFPLIAAEDIIKGREEDHNRAMVRQKSNLPKQ